MVTLHVNLNESILLRGRLKTKKYRYIYIYIYIEYSTYIYIYASSLSVRTVYSTSDILYLRYYTRIILDAVHCIALHHITLHSTIPGSKKRLPLPPHTRDWGQC